MPPPTSSAACAALGQVIGHHKVSLRAIPVFVLAAEQYPLDTLVTADSHVVSGVKAQRDFARSKKKASRVSTMLDPACKRMLIVAHTQSGSKGVMVEGTELSCWVMAFDVRPEVVGVLISMTNAELQSIGTRIGQVVAWRLDKDEVCLLRRVKGTSIQLRSIGALGDLRQPAHKRTIKDDEYNPDEFHIDDNDRMRRVQCTIGPRARMEDFCPGADQALLAAIDHAVPALRYAGIGEAALRSAMAIEFDPTWVGTLYLEPLAEMIGAKFIHNDEHAGRTCTYSERVHAGYNVVGALRISLARKLLPDSVMWNSLCKLAPLLKDANRVAKVCDSAEAMLDNLIDACFNHRFGYTPDTAVPIVTVVREWDSTGMVYRATAALPPWVSKHMAALAGTTHKELCICVHKADTERAARQRAVSDLMFSVLDGHPTMQDWFIRLETAMFQGVDLAALGHYYPPPETHVALHTRTRGNGWMELVSRSMTHHVRLYAMRTDDAGTLVRAACVDARERHDHQRPLPPVPVVNAQHHPNPDLTRLLRQLLPGSTQ